MWGDPGWCLRTACLAIDVLPGLGQAHGVNRFCTRGVRSPNAAMARAACLGRSAAGGFTAPAS